MNSWMNLQTHLSCSIVKLCLSFWYFVLLFSRIFLLVRGLNMMLRQFCSVWILPTVGFDRSLTACLVISWGWIMRSGIILKKRKWTFLRFQIHTINLYLRMVTRLHNSLTVYERAYQAIKISYFFLIERISSLKFSYGVYSCLLSSLLKKIRIFYKVASVSNINLYSC